MGDEEGGDVSEEVSGEWAGVRCGAVVHDPLLLDVLFSRPENDSASYNNTKLQQF